MDPLLPNGTCQIHWRTSCQVGLFCFLGKRFFVLWLLAGAHVCREHLLLRGKTNVELCVTFLLLSANPRTNLGILQWNYHLPLFSSRNNSTQEEAMYTKLYLAMLNFCDVGYGSIIVDVQEFCPRR